MICSECLRYFEPNSRNEVDLTCFSEECKRSRRNRIKTEWDRKISIEVILIMEKIYEKVLIDMGVKR